VHVLAGGLARLCAIPTTSGLCKSAAISSKTQLKAGGVVPEGNDQSQRQGAMHLGPLVARQRTGRSLPPIQAPLVVP
jgi:hypothetical protein